ncbi:MAG: dihydroorotase [Promethearchaeota archaeon]
MILKNAKIYDDGLLRDGLILIDNKIIKKITYNPNSEDLKEFSKQNPDKEEIDCEQKVIIPGIIDIHSHLRDMGQSEKETFLTGTKAAAVSGITTVFNMPNTQPPAITSDQVKKWMDKAKNNIHVNVAFIAGIPKAIDYDEVLKIIELGVIGFKIYPLSSLNEIDWIDHLNVQKLLLVSSEFQIPIFIHPDWPLSIAKREKILQESTLRNYNTLELHNKLYPCQMEAQYVNFILENYYKIIADNNLKKEKYPIVHFCHISCIDSYNFIKKAVGRYAELKISFEITPHHLLLSNKINLNHENFGKVLPPLRDEEHSLFLYNEFKAGNIELIGTDHAPHTIIEKLKPYNEAPSGFPGFETYPLLLLDKVCRYELPLENFVKIASENPAKRFNLRNKGFIKEGYDADLVIVDKISTYNINPQNFKTKAKFSPFEGYRTSVQIWKVFIEGYEINSESKGKIIKK